MNHQSYSTQICSWCILIFHCSSHSGKNPSSLKNPKPTILESWKSCWKKCGGPSKRRSFFLNDAIVFFETWGYHENNPKVLIVSKEHPFFSKKTIHFHVLSQYFGKYHAGFWATNFGLWLLNFNQPFNPSQYITLRLRTASKAPLGEFPAGEWPEISRFRIS